MIELTTRHAVNPTPLEGGGGTTFPGSWPADSYYMNSETRDRVFTHSLDVY